MKDGLGRSFLFPYSQRQRSWLLVLLGLFACGRFHWFCGDRRLHSNLVNEQYKGYKNGRKQNGYVGWICGEPAGD